MGQTSFLSHTQHNMMPRCVTSHPDQLSLLPSLGQEISNGQCGDALQLGVQAGWFTSFVDKCVGGR